MFIKLKRLNKWLRKNFPGEKHERTVLTFLLVTTINIWSTIFDFARQFFKARHENF